MRARLTDGLIPALAGLAVAATLAIVPTAAPASADPPALNPVATGFVGGPGHAGLYGWGAATLPDGSVLIGDYWNMRVMHYAKNGAPLGVYLQKEGFGPGKHQAPYGLAVDPADSSLYIADTDQYKIEKYAPDGTSLLSFGTQGTGAGKFLYPSRVALSSDGTVYVVDTWDSRISVHDKTTGAELFSFGGFGPNLGQMKQPHGAAFDALDRLFVVDTQNSRVQVFSKTGTPLFTFGTKGRGPGKFKGDMRGLAIDKAAGLVYVVDAVGNEVDEWTTDGVYVRSFGKYGRGQGQFSDGGREITVDGDGNVWVGNMPNFSAEKFSPAGTSLLRVPDPVVPPPPGFNGPRGVAVNKTTGDIYVSDTYNWRVERFDKDGNFIQEWGTRGRGDYLFNYARDISIDQRNGDVVLADTDNHRIVKYTSTGVYKWAVGGLGTGTNPPKFKNPHGVTVAPDGTIYVADSRNARVMVLDENGGYLRKFGISGKLPGQFKFPRGIDIGADGNVLVADANRRDVQALTPTGTFVRLIAKGGTTIDKLSAPFGLESDANYIYVADADFNKVNAYSYAGVFVKSFGTPGAALGNLQKPQDVELAQDGTLLVSEQVNDRLTRWNLTGQGVNVVPTLERTIGGPGHAEMYPSGLETDTDGSIVIADTGNNQIARYAANGTQIWRVGSSGEGDQQYDSPRDVGIAGTGEIFVADNSNQRIVKLSSTGAFLTSFRGTGGFKISSPIGISARGNKVYVADGLTKKVQVFDTNGNGLATLVGAGACAFDNVRDAAADADGNVYVANYEANNIVVLSPTGDCIRAFGSKGLGFGQFSNPYGVTIATDPGLGREVVYVADSNAGRVQVFEKDGTFIGTMGTLGERGTPGTFEFLRRVAVRPNGDVVGADLWGNKLQVFTRNAGTTPAWTFSSTIAGSAPGFTSTSMFNEPRGIAFDTDGVLRVVDTVNQRIVRVGADGTPVSTCGQRGYTAGGFNWPRGVAFDQATGDTWVADTKQNYLQVLTQDCTATRLGKAGTGPDGLNWPYSISIRQSDRIAFVADTKNDRVTAWNVATKTPIVSTTGNPADPFKNPSGITVAPNGQIYVADANNNAIVELSYSAGAFTYVRTITGGLLRPNGVALDAAGRIYVADTGNNKVVVFNNAGTVIGTLAGTFNQPQNVAVDAVGRVYVSDTLNDVVKVFTFPGTPPPSTPPAAPPTVTFDRVVVGPGQASIYPVDIVATDTKLFVADPGRYRLVRIDRATGQIDKEAGGTYGEDPGRFSALRGVGLGTDGLVYVADSANNRIQVLNQDFQALRQWGSTGSTDGRFTTIYDVAVGPGLDANGLPATVVYATDDTNRIQEFTTDGTFIRRFGDTSGNKRYRQIAIHPVTNEVYVNDGIGKGVYRFSPTGTQLGFFGGSGTANGKFLGDPRGLGFNADGSLVYVTDSNNERIQYFTAAGAYVGQFGSTLGGGTDDLVDPRGLTVASDGSVFVADAWDFSIKQFTSTGTLLARLLGDPPPTTGVDAPRGVDLDSNGRLIVDDWWNQRVLATNLDGSGTTAWGGRGTPDELGKLNFAWDVAVQPGTNRIFVANRESNEVEVFEADSTPLGGFGIQGTPASGLGRMNFPHSVAFAPDGTLLVADSDNGRVARYSIDANGMGTEIASYGQKGKVTDGPGFFNTLSGVAVTSDGAIWVADTLNNSIQRRDPGTGTWTRISTFSGSTIKQPWAIANDPRDDTLWIADTENDRVIHVAQDGTLLDQVTGFFAGKPLDGPAGLAVSASGKVYVSDLWNNRVLQFTDPS